MLRTILYIGIVLNAIYAVGFLSKKTYRTRETIWLPMLSLGAAIELTALLLGSPLREILVILGAAIVIAAVVASRKRKKRALNGPEPLL